MRGLTLVAITQFSCILEANLLINKPSQLAIRSAPTYYSKSTHVTNKPALFPAASFTLLWPQLGFRIYCDIRYFLKAC